MVAVAGWDAGWRPAPGRLIVAAWPLTGPGPVEPIAAVGEELAQSPSYDTGIAESSNRELILLDQRGTGHSKPSLACPEVDAVAGDLVAGPLSSETVRDVFRRLVPGGFYGLEQVGRSDLGGIRSGRSQS